MLKAKILNREIHIHLYGAGCCPPFYDGICAPEHQRWLSAFAAKFGIRMTIEHCFAAERWLLGHPDLEHNAEQRVQCLFWLTVHRPGYFINATKEILIRDGIPVNLDYTRSPNGHAPNL